MPPLAASRFVPPDNAQDASYFAASAKRRSLVASFSSTAVLYMFFAWRTTHALQCELDRLRTARASGNRQLGSRSADAKQSRALTPKPGDRLIHVGGELGDQRPKSLSVIHMTQMRHFMRRHIVLHEGRRHQQPP